MLPTEGGARRSYPEIAALLDRGDHSTVLHAARAAWRRSAVDPLHARRLAWVVAFLSDAAPCPIPSEQIERLMPVAPVRISPQAEAAAHLRNRRVKRSGRLPSDDPFLLAIATGTIRLRRALQAQMAPSAIGVAA
jgi:hypothetical protein